MKVVDLNILLYAVNRDSAHHATAKSWVEAVLGGDESIAMPWVVVLGFIRVATNPRILPRPLTAEQALDVVDSWMQRPNVTTLAPGDQHWTILRELLDHAGAAGNLTTDAHLAALSIEYDAELCSTDADFGRFRNLRWTNPLG